MGKLNRRSMLRGGGLAALSAGLGSAQRNTDCNCNRASDGSPLDTGTSELRPMIERYDVELNDLHRLYALPGSNVRHSRLERYYSEQLHLLDAVNFDPLSQAGKIDYLLLRGRVLHDQKQLAAESRKEEDIAALIPFQQDIIGLEESRRRMDTLDPQKSAVTLNKISADIEAAKSALPNSKAAPAAMNRAAVRLVELRGYFRTWFNFYHLYDPRFAWWTDAEFKRADEALDAHAKLLHTTSGVGGPLEAPGEGGFRGSAEARNRAMTMPKRWRRAHPRRLARQRPFQQLEATRNSRESAPSGTPFSWKLCKRP